MGNEVGNAGGRTVLGSNWFDEMKLCRGERVVGPDKGAMVGRGRGPGGGLFGFTNPLLGPKGTMGPKRLCWSSWTGNRSPQIRARDVKSTSHQQSNQLSCQLL